MHEDVDTPHEIQDFLLSRRVLHTRIPNYYISTKMNLDNYDGLLTQRNTYKTYRATWNLFSKIAIICFGDLCFKVVTQFNTSIPAKRSFTKLFGVTHVDDESTRAYLKRFNEKMLKVKELIELIALETLISGVKRKVVPACLVDQVNFNAIILLCFSALPLSPQLNVSWISTLLKPLRSSKAKGFRV